MRRLPLVTWEKKLLEIYYHIILSHYATIYSNSENDE